MNRWPGPLFYPTVGSVAVMKCGTRIEVWGDEGDDPTCFTGMNLGDGDASSCWMIDQIDHVEEVAA